MFHIAAFSESFLNDGTLQGVAAVEDVIIFTAGDDLRIPQGFENMLGEMALVGTQAGATRARMVAPSLRGFLNVEMIPFLESETPGDNQHIIMVHPRSPIRLAVGESLNHESEGGGDGATPEDATGLVLLGDGPLQPVEGDIRTVRATTVITTVQREWGSAVLTFSEDLPAGRFAVVGARFEDANLGAGRLIFPGSTHRPGTMGCNDEGSPDIHGARRGMWGIWGEFDINQPPTAEFLSVGGTDTNPIVYLDLMRVA